MLQTGTGHKIIHLQQLLVNVIIWVTSQLYMLPGNMGHFAVLHPLLSSQLHNAPLPH